MVTNKYIILYLKDFNDGILGGNYIVNGKASGEEYFETVLKDKYLLAILYNKKIMINGDNALIPLLFMRTLIELCIETFGVKDVENRIIFRNKDNEYQEEIRLGTMYQTIEFYKLKPKDFKHPDNLRYCKRYNLDKNTKT